MKNTYEIELDDLAIGLTKPATKMGIPFMPFFVSIMLCFFGWMFYQAISGSTNIRSIVFFLLAWAMVYIAMFLITSKDKFGLTIYWVNQQHFRHLANRARWNNTDSYQP